jgi:predicted transcriptional regulator
MENTILKRVGTGFRLSEDGKDLLEQLAEMNGVTQTGIMERAIRELAKQEGVKPRKRQKQEKADSKEA